VTAVSSIDAAQPIASVFTVVAVTIGVPGVVGASVSLLGHTLVEAVTLAFAERLPAASTASTASV
jgi:hypothetical protein